MLACPQGSLWWYPCPPPGPFLVPVGCFWNGWGFCPAGLWSATGDLIDCVSVAGANVMFPIVFFKITTLIPCTWDSSVRGSAFCHFVVSLLHLCQPFCNFPHRIPKMPIGSTDRTVLQIGLFHKWALTLLTINCEVSQNSLAVSCVPFLVAKLTSWLQYIQACTSHYPSLDAWMPDLHMSLWIDLIKTYWLRLRD